MVFEYLQKNSLFSRRKACEICIFANYFLHEIFKFSRKFSLRASRKMLANFRASRKMLANFPIFAKIYCMRNEQFISKTFVGFSSKTLSMNYADTTPLLVCGTPRDVQSFVFVFVGKKRGGKIYQT